MDSDRERFSRLTATARQPLVLTGAGVSAESGVPTFRGTDGLWHSHRAEELATSGAFTADPELGGAGTTGAVAGWLPPAPTPPTAGSPATWQNAPGECWSFRTWTACTGSPGSPTRWRSMAACGRCAAPLAGRRHKTARFSPTHPATLRRVRWSAATRSGVVRGTPAGGGPGPRCRNRRGRGPGVGDRHLGGDVPRGGASGPGPGRASGGAQPQTHPPDTRSYPRRARPGRGVSGATADLKL